MQGIATVDYHCEQGPQQFAESLHNTGFAIIENHPIDRGLLDQAYGQWQDFFHSDYKDDFLFDKATHDGYIPMSLSEVAKGNDLKDIKEFYHLYAKGRCPQPQTEVSFNLFRQLSELAAEVLHWVDTHTPSAVRDNFSMPLPHMVAESDHTLLRVINYPPLTGDEQAGAVRAAAHEDINLLTLLPGATADGLQVLSKSGDWIDVVGGHGNIIVNSGDMLGECSNGYYRATTHRVVNPEGEAAKQARLSMPLFLHARDEVVLSERYSAGSYRAERFKELGLD